MKLLPLFQQIPNAGTLTAANQPAVSVAAAAAGANTVHIPGIGNVQVVTGAGVQQVMAAAQAPATAAANLQQVQQMPQLLAPAPQQQQALQQDANDPTKWHMVQVAAAPQMAAAGPVIAAAAPTMQVMAAAPVTSGSAASKGNAQKTRLRRVACTCPNCKDGDRTRSK